MGLSVFLLVLRPWASIGRGSTGGSQRLVDDPLANENMILAF